MTNQDIKTILSHLDQGAILCELPESEFETGGAINEACRAAGYWDSGRVTINDLNIWPATVAELAAILQIKECQPSVEIAPPCEFCEACGQKLTEVRPGKTQCDYC